MHYLQKTIHQLFEEQAKKYPHKIAVSFDSQKLTYQELNNRANRLAAFLINKKIKKEEIIAIAMKRCPEMFVAILSVLKAGGACLLVDPGFPPKRIGQILKDSRTKIILTCEETTFSFAHKKGVIINIKKLPYQPFSKNKTLDITPKNLAFILYTSGSTGKPKGVMLEHKGIINQVFHRIKFMNLSSNYQLALNSPVSFINFISQSFAPLFIGATLNIFSDEESLSPMATIKKAEKLKINQVELSIPAIRIYLSFIENHKKNKTNLKSLKVLLVTGEKLTPDLVNLFFKHYPKIRLMNPYGQTECCGMTLSNEIKFKKDLKIISEGKPTTNNQAYVLNRDMQVQPIGIPGELYISGKSLARGYLNDPQRTKKIFLPHPFIKGKRIYKTGDLAKMHEDGNIEILGRVDRQVKIRGNRVEPGEIETRLLKHKDIKQCVVVAREDKKSQEQYLSAYFAAKKNVDVSGLRNFLKKTLPGYMIPMVFVRLKELPLNQNGKIDRLNLPEPILESTSKYKPPRTNIEKKLVKIWQEILEVKKIGLNDNFFDLGINSLKAIRINSEINSLLKIKISLIEFLKYSTIKEIVKCIEKKHKLNLFKNNKKGIIKKYPKKYFYPLSWEQEKIWRTEKNLNIKNWHAPYLLYLKGDLNISALEKAINLILDRHRILRTSFLEKISSKNEIELVQIINKHKPFHLPLLDLSKHRKNNKKNFLNKIIKSETKNLINPKEERFFQAKIIKTAASNFIFLVYLPSTTYDLRSVDIFFKEMGGLYDRFKNNKKLTLPKLPIEYTDYAIWSRDDKKQIQKIKNQKKFWEKELSTGESKISLPFVLSKNSQNNTAKNTQITIKSEDIQEIDSFIKKNRISHYIFFLSAFYAFLYTLNKNRENIITSFVSNRKSSQLQNIFGPIYNHVPTKIKIQNNDNFLSVLNKIERKNITTTQSSDFYEYNQLRGIKNKKGSLVFNVFFRFTDYRLNFQLADLKIKFKKNFVIDKNTTYDLLCDIRQQSTGLIISFITKKDKTDIHMIKKTMEKFSAFLKKTTKNPQKILITK